RHLPRRQPRRNKPASFPAALPAGGKDPDLLRSSGPGPACDAFRYINLAWAPERAPRAFHGDSPMTRPASPGALFRQALAAETPLQIIGPIHANPALLAKRAGYRAIYLSGGGVAAGSLGLPDLGINTLDDVLTDVRRITDVCDVPLLVDIDTGFGPSAFNIARTVKSLIKFGAA